MPYVATDKLTEAMKTSYSVEFGRVKIMLQFPISAMLRLLLSRR